VISRLVGNAFLLLVLAVAASGCMGDVEEERFSKDDLRKLVLQPEDLPRVFTRFDFRELAPSDFHQGPRENPAAFGRTAGWVARYRRSGSAETRGPLVIESRVDLFEDEDGAEDDLAAYEEEFRRTANATMLEPPRIGTETVAMTLSQGSGRFAVRFFTIAWRESTVTASVTLNGFDGNVALPDALKVARQQQRHIQKSAA
jgi:hypothetical protein